MTPQRWPEDVGSLGEEAGRLLESLRRAGADSAGSADAADAADSAASHAAARRTAHPPTSRPAQARHAALTPPAPQQVPPAEAADEAAAGERQDQRAPTFSCQDPVCQWCPVCRASTFVRQLSPETLSGLAELAGFAATVLTDLAGARARQDAPATHEEEGTRD